MGEEVSEVGVRGRSKPDCSSKCQSTIYLRLGRLPYEGSKVEYLERWHVGRMIHTDCYPHHSTFRVNSEYTKYGSSLIR